jgi:hypothetical protein
MGNLSAYFANGWQVFSHPLFLEQIAILRATVERLALRDPENVASHRDAKILAAISKMAFEVIQVLRRPLPFVFSIQHGATGDCAGLGE